MKTSALVLAVLFLSHAPRAYAQAFEGWDYYEESDMFTDEITQIIVTRGIIFETSSPLSNRDATMYLRCGPARKLTGYIATTSAYMGTGRTRARFRIDSRPFHSIMVAKSSTGLAVIIGGSSVIALAADMRAGASLMVGVSSQGFEYVFEFGLDGFTAASSRFRCEV